MKSNALLIVAWMLTGSSLGDDRVDFSRQVRPILASRCLKCHGRSDTTREAGLRLDRRPSAVATLPSGHQAVVPGKAMASALISRVASADPDLRMPPDGPPLSRQQVDLLSRWINQGADWGQHWAYVVPRRPVVPTNDNDPGAVNPIDRFIRHRLERERLVPSNEADKNRLCRRLYLDLTGLPPTLEQLDAFLNDTSPGAYLRLVERLLASPRYGERMAIDWLDAARYADTHGYQVDAHRDMWRWREWVIDAFNTNMPFDQFTVEQLAGDLLPHPTLDQWIATGFHRNHMVNLEGGAIEEEYLAEYVADRVVTTATVWLGQTFECARCHDHKYDPFAQRDFYRLAAFFNNIDELGLDGGNGNAKPFLPAPTDWQRHRHTRLTADARRWQDVLRNRRRESVNDQAAWERMTLSEDSNRLESPAVYLPLDAIHGQADQLTTSSTNGRPFAVHGSAQSIAGRNSRFGNSLLLGGETWLEVGDAFAFTSDKPFSLSLWIFPTTAEPQTLLSHFDPAAQRGLEIRIEAQRLVVRRQLAANSRDEFVATAELRRVRWQNVCVTFDGRAVRAFVDGTPLALDKRAGRVGRVIQGKSPQIGRGFRGMLDEVRIYSRGLTATEAATLARSDPIRDIVVITPARRTAGQRQRLQNFYLENEDAAYRAAAAELDRCQSELDRLNKRIPTTMVMRERTDERPTFVLKRGDYRYPAERVTAGLPELFGSPAVPPNRLGLAKWLVSKRNPLTARVFVNRLWAKFFGTGLVATGEDFGTRGEPPEHPELLDWLAVEFQQSGWDIKHVQRLIVSSATYRQTSRTTTTARQRDPRNRLLARGPGRRLPAEIVRDNALFISGLLDDRIGGISVRPYQPRGLWRELSFDPAEFTAQVYLSDFGRDLYRRSLYTFWKRTVPPPSLIVFDAPSRETCVVRRDQTTTPLQALVLMNDPTYVEAARALAARLITETDPEDRIAYAWRLALSRSPRPAEVRVLSHLVRRELAGFRRHPEAANELLSVGESNVPAGIDPAELAAWTIVASTILNLDETITAR